MVSSQCDRSRSVSGGSAARRHNGARVARWCLPIFAITLLPSLGQAEQLPFEYTEPREPCANYVPERQPLFGVTHLHTGLSYDASLRSVSVAAGNRPKTAYTFAKGETRITLPDAFGFQGGRPLRTPRIDRPVDWGAVTDHSEFFGEMGICKNFLGRDVAGRTALECRLLNGFFWIPRELSNLLVLTGSSAGFTAMSFPNIFPTTRNTTTPLCLDNPDECTAGNMEVWDEMQTAAEQEYDRSSACSFTTFVAYENTSTPSGTNWHRNVIFRNDRVIRKPITAIDLAVRKNRSPTTRGPDGVGRPPGENGSFVSGRGETRPIPPGTFVTHPIPERLWNRLERECLRGRNITGGRGFRCDAITIPHNSNLGTGLAPLVPPMFFKPFNTEDAALRQKWEPLVEIYQNKGSSECRWDPRFAEGVPNNPAAGVETIDEFCNFEILDTVLLQNTSVQNTPTNIPLAPQDVNPAAYVRNVWKQGLQFATEDFDGVNPFKMGTVASSDTHNGTLGWHPENASWPGHLGIADAWPVQRGSTMQNSSGGHSVVWAEENSRDSIFAALKRKETFGTSGPRIVVRFFGGWNFKDDACANDFVRQGYRRGVPMGGDLEPAPGRHRSPKFIVAAWADPDSAPLQQIQIVKGWYDFDEGTSLEQVVRVIGERGRPNNAEAGLIDDTCFRKPGGHDELCTVWEDPDFDPDQPAFYYARVIERPVCRYSTDWCIRRIGVNPFEDDCEQQLLFLKNGTPEEQFRWLQGQACCLNETTDYYIQRAIQERAWTSPIWYEPDGF